MSAALLLLLLSLPLPLPLHAQLRIPPISLQLLLLLPFPTKPALCHCCCGLLMPLRRCHLRCHCRCRASCRCRYYSCGSCCCCCRCCRTKRQASAIVSDAVCPFDHGTRERAFHACSAWSRFGRFDHSQHRPFIGGFGSRESRCCCADYSQSSKSTRHRLQLLLLCARTFHPQGGRELL